MLFAAVSAADGVLAIAAPVQFLHAIWPTRDASGAELFVRGWGACLLALSALAWINRNAQDPFVCRSIAFALFVYFGIAAFIWFIDAQVVGWTLMSAATFAGLAFFATTFAYLRFLTLARVRRT
jgi:hypothetical protein